MVSEPFSHAYFHEGPKSQIDFLSDSQWLLAEVAPPALFPLKLVQRKSPLFLIV